MRLQQPIESIHSTSMNDFYQVEETTSVAPDRVIKLFIHISPNTPSDAKEQIEFLKDKLGFNISEIAEILSQTRPTIYNWLGGSKLSIKNQARLDEVCNALKSANHSIAHLSRRKWVQNESLYDLLCAPLLDFHKIGICLEQIDINISETSERDKKRAQFLQEHNYEKNNKKDMKKVVEKLTRKMG